MSEFWPIFIILLQLIFLEGILSIDNAAVIGALVTPLPDDRRVEWLRGCGKVAGAALDVFEKEPPGLTELVTHPGLIATPHIGAQTSEAQSRAAEDIAAEVLSALHGQPLRWRVA